MRSTANVASAALLLVSGCVLLVGGYDWSDADFNMALLHDLDQHIIPYHHGYDDENEGGRFKRATMDNNSTKDTEMMAEDQDGANCSPKPMKKSCCGDKDDLKMHGAALKPLRRMCFAEIRKLRGMMTEEEAAIDVFDWEKVKQTKEDLVCIMECVGRKKNMTDSQGNIMPENSRAFIKKELAMEDWQKAMIDGVLDKCFKNLAMMNTTTTTMSANNATMNQKNATLSGDVPKDSRCNPTMLNLSHCIWREIQLNCPQDLTKNDTFCQKLRERLTKNANPKVGGRMPRPQSEKSMKN